MHQIRYFLAVAESLNFTRAAEECNVTQPSLSRAIQRLEEEFGGPLFHRERSRTHLTPLGLEMLPLLRQVFEGAAAAKEQAASHLKSEHAVLRVGISSTVHLSLISPQLAELTRAFPGLELRLVRSPAPQVVEGLSAGDLELAVMACADDAWDRLECWPMFSEGFVVLVPPDSTTRSVQLSDLEAAAVIARPYCETVGGGVETGSGRSGSAPPRHEVSSEDDAAVLVQERIGVAIVPESSGRFLPADTATLAGFETTRTVGVYAVAGRRRSPVANAMLQLMRAADWSAPSAA